MGIGDWGLGIGDWGLGPIPNPQSPIPNPQSPFNFLFYIPYIILLKLINFLKYKINFIITYVYTKNNNKNNYK